MKVYLAGNMVTDWRKPIMTTYPEIEWIEPAHGDDWFERTQEQMHEADVCLAFIDMEARHIRTIADLSIFIEMGKPRVVVLHPDRIYDLDYIVARELASPGLLTMDLAEGVRFITEFSPLLSCE